MAFRERLVRYWVLVTLLAQPTVAASQCAIEQQRRFPADNEPVRLVRDGSGGRFALFSAPLAVNTDGAPNSYHPEDYSGERLAINRIPHGITIRRSDARRTTPAERRRVFDQWRSSPQWAVPPGYRISWGNVIAADPQGRPCRFRSGPHTGYFGSLTALRNGLSGAAAGECLVNDQLDQRFIPAIVLRGGAANPLTSYGAATGDLILAINPRTNAVVPAIIGDAGDGNRIGEGSVALNMALLGRTEQPTTYAEAVRLDTGNQEMLLAVLPRSRAFQRLRPYSRENIASRVNAWAAANGYGSTEGLAAALRRCASGL
jgi:hypothetical protein